MRRIILVAFLCLLFASAASAQSRLQCASGSTNCDLSHGLSADVTWKGVQVPFNWALDNVATAAPHPIRNMASALQMASTGGAFTCTAFGTTAPVNCALDLQECPGSSGGVTGCTTTLSANLVLTALNVGVTAAMSDMAWASSAFLKPVYVSGVCSEVTVCRLVGETIP